MSYQPKSAKISPRLLSLKRQQGVVIVVALFVVALVATMAYVMMGRLERDTRRTQLILRDTQANYYAQGSVAWAMDTLRSDWEKQQPGQVVDPIPIKSPINEMQGYQIKSTIYDMQARFNLNNLIHPESQMDFKQLLMLTVPSLTEEKAQEIVFAVTDWVSPGTQQNVFKQYYAQLPIPYRAAHRLMYNVSELRLIKGITPALFHALSPYVTALPATTQVNVQTASAAVLAALSLNMSLETGNAIVTLRDTTPFVSTQTFLNLDIVKNHAIKPEKITDRSTYFLVETVVGIEKQQTVLYTLLERTIKQDKVAVNILWQSKGFW